MNHITLVKDLCVFSIKKKKCRARGSTLLYLKKRKDNTLFKKRRIDHVLLKKRRGDHALLKRKDHALSQRKEVMLY